MRMTVDKGGDPASMYRVWVSARGVRTLLKAPIRFSGAPTQLGDRPYFCASKVVQRRSCRGSFVITPAMKRIIVIGTSCSGKTTLARKLAAKLDMPHIELDRLFWLPEWKQRPAGEFRSLVQKAVDAERWVSCGNFSTVRDILWPHATHAIWLDYSFHVVIYRTLYRTIGRAITKEELFCGNYESIRQSFCSRDSILWWVLKTFRKNRRRYEQLRDEQTYPNLNWIEFRHPKDADRFLANQRYV